MIATVYNYLAPLSFFRKYVVNCIIYVVAKNELRSKLYYLRSSEE